MQRFPVRSCINFLYTQENSIADSRAIIMSITHHNTVVFNSV